MNMDRNVMARCCRTGVLSLQTLCLVDCQVIVGVKETCDLNLDSQHQLPSEASSSTPHLMIVHVLPLLQS